MNTPSSTDRLHHMLDAARKARQFAEKRTRADLETDEMFALRKLGKAEDAELLEARAKHIRERAQASPQ